MSAFAWTFVVGGGVPFVTSCGELGGEDGDVEQVQSALNVFDARYDSGGSSPDWAKLAADIVSAFDWAKDKAKRINDTLGPFTGAYSTVKTLGEILGLLPNNEAVVENRILDLISQVRGDLEALSGAVLGHDYIVRLSDITNKTIELASLSQSAREIVIRENKPLTGIRSDPFLSQSRTLVNQLADNPAYFLRPFHGTKNEDDQNLGDTKGFWKQIIPNRPAVESGPSIWDWRMGLPALVEGIAERITVLAAADTAGFTSGFYRADLLHYRERLIQIRDRIVANTYCNAVVMQDVSLGHLYDLRTEVYCVEIGTGTSMTSSTPVRVSNDLNAYCRDRPSDTNPCPPRPTATFKERMVNWSKWPWTKFDKEFPNLVYPARDRAYRALHNRIGLSGAQQLIDKLYALANNTRGPLELGDVGQLRSQIAPNRCVGADPGNAQALLKECSKTITMTVSTPGGPQQVQVAQPQTLGFVFNPANGQLVYGDGRCLDAQSTANPGTLGFRAGTPDLLNFDVSVPVKFAPCGFGDGQRWMYDAETRLLRNARGTVLDIQWSNQAPGTPMWTWSINGTTAQLWGS